MSKKLMLLIVGYATILYLTVANAAEFKLVNGDIIIGTLADANEDGLIVAKEAGGFSSRIPWAKLSQETLKVVAENPKYKQFAEPFIDVPLEVRAKALEKRKPKPVQIQMPPKLDLPDSKASFFSTLKTPIGIAFLLIIYIANLYAAFEVAVYKRRPTAIVCGISALLPILGPSLFAAVPAAMHHESSETQMQTYEGGGHMPTGAETAVASTLSVAKPAQAESKSLQPKVYNRGEYTFNRRFFETQFPGFFRVVLVEPEKNMVIIIKTGRSSLIAKRISRISANEVHLVLHKSGKEMPVSFGDITQVEIAYESAVEK